jgi:predicted permease
VVTKFSLIAGMILAATAAGYGCRRSRLLTERVGEVLMTLVAVFGYPTVSFFTVWGVSLRLSDALLPFMACVHSVVMVLLSLGLAGLVTKDRHEKGLLGIAGGFGNNGFTMGAFVLYLLYGEQALGLANVYFVVFVPLIVVLMYPVARHYSGERSQGSLLALMKRNLWDWRSIGLPINVVAIVLSARGIPRPHWISDGHLVDILVYAITPAAFFGIGLRLHGSRVIPMWRMLVWLAGVRFVLGAAAGLALACLTRLSPWGFQDLRWNVYLVQAFVPTSVTMVAVANMFNLKPREASVLFVVNTAMYLLLVLPLVFWIFGG